MRELGTWTIEDGKLSVEQPHPDIYVARWTGRLKPALFDQYERICRPSIRYERRPDVFGDYSKIVAYETHYRLKATDWLIRHRRLVRSMHVLIPESKLGSMAVSVANMAINNAMTLYTRPELFEQAIVDAANRRELPNYDLAGTGS